MINSNLGPILHRLATVQTDRRTTPMKHGRLKNGVQLSMLQRLRCDDIHTCMRPLNGYGLKTVLAFV